MVHDAIHAIASQGKSTKNAPLIAAVFTPTACALGMSWVRPDHHHRRAAFWASIANDPLIRHWTATTRTNTCSRQDAPRSIANQGYLPSGAAPGKQLHQHSLRAPSRRYRCPSILHLFAHRDRRNIAVAFKSINSAAVIAAAELRLRPCGYYWHLMTTLTPISEVTCAVAARTGCRFEQPCANDRQRRVRRAETNRWQEMLVVYRKPEQAAIETGSIASAR